MKNFAQALVQQTRLGFTSGQKVGVWDYNNSPIIAVVRPEGTVILVKDGLPATTYAIKGRTWLKNLGYSQDVLNQIMDDTNGVTYDANLFYSKTSNVPTVAEIALFTANSANTSTVTPISLTNNSTVTTVKSWASTTNGKVGIVAGLLALGGLLYWAFKK